MSSIRIEEVKAHAFERYGAHSHIRGLGVRDGKVQYMADGFVGQVEAREAAYMIVKLVKEGKFAGKGVLIVGPPGTGKTALAIGIARELGEDTPFVSISAAEIYGAEVKKTEFLMRALRKAIGIRYREWRKVYEGVVKSMDIRYSRHPYNPYIQIPVSATIRLRTADDEKTLRVPQEIAVQLVEKGIEEGDVIMIDEETGNVTVIGKGEEKEEYDIRVKRRVELPKGPVYKEKEIVRFFTLADLDDYLAKQRGLITASIFGFIELTREVPEEIRRQADEWVKRAVEQGNAELVPGVLFIDDAHLLDIEAYAFLSRAIESELAPILILATNRGIAKIYGTDIESPHGIPRDMLDRLVIIRTRPYNKQEIMDIVRIKAEERKIKVSEDAIKMLGEIGEQYGLRYAVQLLDPAWMHARDRGADRIEPSDVEYARKLFVPVRESVEFVKQYEGLFL